MEQLNGVNEQDPLYPEAVALVREKNKASVSMIQRHFRLGYNRGARLIEEMQKAGVIGEMDNQGRRKVLT